MYKCVHVYMYVCVYTCTHTHTHTCHHANAAEVYTTEDRQTTYALATDFNLPFSFGTSPLFGGLLSTIFNFSQEQACAQYVCSWWTRMYTDTHTHTRTHTYKHTHAHTQTQTHTRTHAHTHNPNTRAHKHTHKHCLLRYLSVTQFLGERKCVYAREKEEKERERAIWSHYD